MTDLNPPREPDTMGAPILAPSGDEPASTSIAAVAAVDALAAVSALTDRLVALEQRVADLEELL